MQKLTEIKSRIKSISDTRKITAAMEMISVAKMRKAIQKAESNNPFFLKVLETMREIALKPGAEQNRFFRPAGPGKTLYIVIASDKGLAGGFNANVLKRAYGAMQKDSSESLIFTVGYVAREFFDHHGLKIETDFSDVPANFSGAFRIADEAAKIFLSGKACRASVVYTQMYANRSMEPTVTEILPLGIKPGQKPDTGEIEYDPSPEAVLEKLVPEYLRWVIYGALIQSGAAEHYARRLAMNNATKNAAEILENLQLGYHRARQESVTTELNEIVSTGMGVRK